MKLYYLANIIGTGEADVDEFRTALNDYPLSCGADIPCNPETGVPLNDWALAYVFGGDPSLLVGDARIDPMPTCPLDTPVALIDAGQMAVMQAALTRRNIGIGIDPAGTYGDIMAAITLRANAGNNTPTIAPLEM